MPDCAIDIHETWGFYVDIEKDEQEQEYKNPPIKNVNQNIYTPDYYYDDYHEDYYEHHSYYEPKKKDTSMANLLIKVSSTTLATIGITYLLLCVL
jgi:hypothetical protein